MTEDKDSNENRTLEAARASLDKSVDDMPQNLSAALAAARQNALEAGSNAETTEKESNVVPLRPALDRSKMVWGGAIAASCAALALTLVLRQPGEEFLPLDAGDSFALQEAEDSMFLLTEMDETEWDLVQELEFALWLSEFGDEASAADFSG